MTAGSPDSCLSGLGIKHQCQVVSIVCSLAFHFFQKEFQFQEHFVSIFILPYLSLCFLSG